MRLLQGMPRATGVRWCNDRQLHITLKFLGDVSDTQLPDVCKVVEDACAQVAPFNIRVRGLGVFPAPQNPRVLWCGVEDPTASCRRWVELADPGFTALRFKREARAFTPHITLGRSRSTPGAQVLRRVLDETKAPETAEMEVHQVLVFESHLRPGGAHYEPLATVPLTG